MLTKQLFKKKDKRVICWEFLFWSLGSPNTVQRYQKKKQREMIGYVEREAGGKPRSEAQSLHHISASLSLQYPPLNLPSQAPEL
jgi:hypothetical protein